MPEVETPVDVVRVVYQCDKCGEGYMWPTGFAFATLPPRHGHRCNKCGAQMDSSEHYPTIRYVPREPQK